MQGVGSRAYALGFRAGLGHKRWEKWKMVYGPFSAKGSAFKVQGLVQERLKKCVLRLSLRDFT